jgi:Transglutaminase-like superfamily/TgpA N-terminal domain
MTLLTEPPIGSGPPPGPRTGSRPGHSQDDAAAASAAAGTGTGSAWTARAGALAAVIVVTALAALPALVYDDFFDGGRHRAVIAAAALAGAIAGAVAGAWRGLRRLGLTVLSLLSAVPVLLVLLTPATRGVPTLGNVAALGDQVLHGWARMVTTGTPAEAQAEVLALPAALAWAAAFIAVLLLRDPAHRLLPALPPVTAICVGLVLTAAGGPPRWPLAAAMVALAVLLLMLRPGSPPPVMDPAARATMGAAPDPAGGMPEQAQTLSADSGTAGRSTSRLLTVLIGVVLLAVLTGAAVAAVRVLPAQALRAPYDPRSDARPVTELIDASSPMIGLKRQLQPPVRQLFTVQVVKSQLRSGAPPIVRVAALDSFDGSTWQVTGQYLRPGARIPGPAGLRRPLDVTLRITTSGLTGPMLPVLQGRTSRLDLPEVRVDASGTNAIATRALSPGLTYEVTGVVPGGNERNLAAAAPDLTGDAAGTTRLPELPAQFARLATRLTSGTSEPYAQLLAIRDWLRRLPYSTEGPPGESYAVLDPILFGPAGDGRNRPSSFAEQRVSAFTVLARSAGFPARVAVGYQVDPARASGGVIPVTSADVRAWAEVKLAGYGWVRFDPTDTSQTVDSAPRDDQQLQQQQATGTSSDQSVIDPGLQPDDVKRTGGGGVAGLMLGLLVLPALVPVLLVAGWLAKLVRRRRRRTRGGPREQILGAWRESRDRLLESGRAPARSQTPADAAREHSLVPGGADGPLLQLAPLVDRAVFAPWEPDAADATAAWAAYDRLRAALNRAAESWTRPVRALDPRPLWHRPGDRAVRYPAAWPVGLRTPAPDTGELAPILAGAVSDPDHDLLIESMLAPVGAGGAAIPNGTGRGVGAAAWTPGGAGDVFVERPGAGPGGVPGDGGAR